MSLYVYVEEYLVVRECLLGFGRGRGVAFSLTFFAIQHLNVLRCELQPDLSNAKDSISCSFPASVRFSFSRFSGDFWMNFRSS